MINVIRLLNRIIWLQLGAKRRNLNIIQMYALTTECEEQEISHFYEFLGGVTEIIPKEEVLVVMGDYNAKLSINPVEDIVGKYV